MRWECGRGRLFILLEIPADIEAFEEMIAVKR